MAGVNEQLCFTTETKEEILARLRRAEGQIRGIQKMIEEERSCQDLIIQLVAVKNAIAQIAVTALSKQMVHCLATDIQDGKSVEMTADNFLEVFKKLI